MPERKKSISIPPSSSASEDVERVLVAPGRRTKRARLTRSTSGLLITNTGDNNSDEKKKNPGGLAGDERLGPSESSSRSQGVKSVEASVVSSSMNTNASALNGGHSRSLSQNSRGPSQSQSQTQSEMQSSPTPTSRLSELLDMTSISSHEDISFRFGQIARSLMHDHLLVVSKVHTPDQDTQTEYELLEVEFYLRKEGHEDPFTHATPEQVEAGKWYFHRAPQKSEDPTRSATSLTGYRGGTRKGVDLTFGGPVSSPYFQRYAQNGKDEASSILGRKVTRGGILFRSMRRLADGAVISGPSLLVDELLRVCGCASVSQLVSEALGKDTSAFPSQSSSSLSSPTGPTKMCSISIRPRRIALVKKPTVYSSPRIGLDLSHPRTTASPRDPRIVFVQKPYRFFVSPSILTANGRPQTFLGIYNLISEADILNESGVLDEVARLTGIKRASCEKYAADFQQGKANGQIERFIGPVGKGASSSPSTYLQLMGTLAQSCGS